jgi:erythromycin esterase-like protein
VNLAGAMHLLTGSPHDYDVLLDRIGDACYVLLGEASHGTHDFYRERAAITQRLIEERGFTAVADEADWPDAYCVNCYVRGRNEDAGAGEALGDFRRFPAWMWRNLDVLAFVEWLRARNDELPDEDKAGFYGLDLYSLFASIEAVVDYLEGVDPEAARRARERYACLEQFGPDANAYGLTAADYCEDDVVEQLLELQRRAAELASRAGRIAEGRFFYAEQNARLVRNAERYYRSVYRGRVSSWNLRDGHMAETLDELVEHLDRGGRETKAVVWAHNSHVGDARATALGAAGELNLGQLVRERHPGESFLLGFTTYAGTVTAASSWGGEAERKRVRPALPESYEALFHRLGVPQFLLSPAEVEELDSVRLERAIGVIYRPETRACEPLLRGASSCAVDAVVHLDETTAVEPFERTSEWEAGELPETYPFVV